MHTFTDAIGEEWAITLDTTLCREIRSATKVDLLALDKDSMASLISDDAMLVDVVSLACTDQIKLRKLDERGFARRLVNDALDNALEALIGELVFICRQASKRKVMQAAWNKAKQAVEKLNQHATALLESEQMDQELDKLIQQHGL